MNRAAMILAALVLVAVATQPVSGRSYVVLDSSLSLWAGDVCDPPPIQARAQSSHSARVVSLYIGHKGESLQLLGQVKRHRQGCGGSSVLRGVCQASRRITKTGQTATCNIPMFYTACDKGHRTYTRAIFTAEVNISETGVECLSVGCEQCPEC